MTVAIIFGAIIILVRIFHSRTSNAMDFCHGGRCTGKYLYADWDASYVGLFRAGLSIHSLKHIKQGLMLRLTNLKAIT